MADDADEITFIPEDVMKIVENTIETVIGKNNYNYEKVPKWCDTIVDNCVTTFAKQEKEFKYVVLCTILQKTGAGLHIASSCYWDTLTDGQVTVRWENKTMYVISTVYGMTV